MLGRMRYMLDTCSLIHLTQDYELLSHEVQNIIEDYENSLYVSMESIRELIIAYRCKGLGLKTWEKESDIINSIEDDFQINILPIQKEQMQTYANLEINTIQDHRDPSDHVIIAHAITNKMPLISCDRKFEFYTRQGLELISYRKGRS